MENEKKNNKKMMIIYSIIILLLITLIGLCIYIIVDNKNNKDTNNNGTDNNEINNSEQNNDNTSNENNDNDQDKDNIDNENNTIAKKVLYFYEQDGKLYIDEENKNNNYIGSYNCKSDDCIALLSAYYGPGYDINKKTTMIRDNNNKNYFIYNYKTNEIVSDTYNFIHAIDKYLAAEKNDKIVLLNWDGKEISSYYDDIFNWNNIRSVAPPQNYSLVKNIVAYEHNGKFGLLSLKDGSEITEAKYDNMSIYDDNVITTINGLDYAMDSNGNIKSKGYKKVLSSNDKIIIVQENEMIDIVDYSGNSKIEEKIPTNGHSYNRINYYECIGPSCMPIKIKYDNNEVIINVAYKNYDELFWESGVKKQTKYIYDLKKESLTVEEQ